MYLNLLYITVVVVIILDLSGFYEEITTMISKWLSGGKIAKPIYIKPFSCSFCMSHWLNLIYILCLGKFTIFNYMVILLLSTATPLIKDTIILITELIKKILNGTYERFIR